VKKSKARRIKLYPIPETEGYLYLNLPKGAQPAGFYEEKDGLEIGLIVNEEAALEKKKFLIIREGDEIKGPASEKLVPIGLFVRKKVFFVFEIK